MSYDGAEFCGWQMLRIEAIIPLHPQGTRGRVPLNPSVGASASVTSL